jgi:hypothetical protein
MSDVKDDDHWYNDEGLIGLYQSLKKSHTVRFLAAAIIGMTAGFINHEYRHNKTEMLKNEQHQSQPLPKNYKSSPNLK